MAEVATTNTPRIIIKEIPKNMPKSLALAKETDDGVLIFICRNEFIMFISLLISLNCSEIKDYLYALSWLANKFNNTK